MNEMLGFWVLISAGAGLLMSSFFIGEFRKDTGDYNLAIPLLLCLGVMTTIAGVAFYDAECKKPDEDKYIDEHYLIYRQICEYDNDTDYELVHELYHRCEEFDRIPAKHLRLCHSRWRGRGYTENIGTLPSLKELFLEKFNNDKDDKDKMVL